MKFCRVTLLMTVLAAALCVSQSVRAQEESADPYETYIKTSNDFKRVKQESESFSKAWPAWIYMPWYYQWTIGHNDEGGKFSVDNGFNGAFLDNGDTKYLDWINKFKLRFYQDHTASKGYLYIRNSNNFNSKTAGPMRTPLLNAATRTELEGIIKKNIEAVKASPYRAAYGLDDEISWGSFIKPLFWQLTDNQEAYKKWLEEIYGKDKAPKYGAWINYNTILPKLREWSIGTFDASQLMDQLTFNDSYWNNYLGGLVEYANTIDPETPVGFEGGQCPNAFGGFDYAKVMRKVQWLEAYNIGGSQSIVRSFNPKNALPTVTTHFHSNSNDDIWQTWYYVAHGNRGFIGWVEGWFEGSTPKPWFKEVAPTFKEVEEKISPLQIKSEWIHDGVAIYYSHASIQMSWVMDAEAHGKTWVNRHNDAALGSSHNNRHAWENMLRDEGIQYSYVSYVDAVQTGIPKEYKVLILPGTYCLSDVEAQRIREFCKNGGTVIADYLPGCWDQHGKGRAAGGVLDDVFGVKHNPALKSAGIFGGKLWCETDQEANYSFKKFDDLLTNNCNCVKDASGFNTCVRDMGVDHVNKFGSGSAVLMNLSPQWYNAYRTHGFEDAKKREVFMKHIKAAGIKRWVEIENAGAKEFGYEITYWKKGGRTLLFVCSNPELAVSNEGGGNSVGLKHDDLDITLKFAKAPSDIVDERSGKKLGDGDTVKIHWKMNEAAVLSFKQ